MPHGRIHRPCPPTHLYVQLSTMRLYIHAFVHAFAMFLRVSKMLYGTASGDEFAVSQACLMDAFISHAHLPYAYVQLSAMRLLYARFCFVIEVSKMLYGTASGDEFAVSQACLMDAFISHVHLPCAYVQVSAMRLLYARFCFVIEVSKMLYGTASGDEFAVSQACLMDAFISQVHMDAFISHVHLPCAYVQVSAMRLLYARFCFVFQVSKMLYGTASGNQFGTPWARILLGFRCFATMPHGRVHRPCPPICLYVQLSAMRLLYARVCFVFTGFEDVVRHRLWG